jgi:hypothetical protein
MFFSSVHKRFITESYFRNGVFNNKEWTYSAVACLTDFRQYTIGSPAEQCALSWWIDIDNYYVSERIFGTSVLIVTDCS